jgi:formate--tetrahydrofolate ligase
MAAENPAALTAGMANLQRHVDNIREHYGLPCVVAVNHRSHDTEAEFALLERHFAPQRVPVVSSRHWAEGGAGAEALARCVVELTSGPSKPPRFVYEDGATLWEKLAAVAGKIYGAGQVTADADVRAKIQALEDGGYGRFPICIAKTQYSFSTDPQRRGAPEGHVVTVREVRLAAGAEFIVLICGDVLTMPGLPKHPSAARIDIDAAGRVVGLF